MTTEQYNHARNTFETVRDEKATHANTATRIGEAFLLLLELLRIEGGQYLSKNGDDTAEGVITFLRGLLIGDGSYGIGADGLARLRSAIFSEKVTTEALEVNGWARFEKLVYNMLQLQEQDMLLSGGGDVERVIDNHDGTYTLVMHKEAEDKHVALAEYDILKGKVNEPMPSGSSATEYTSWMRVCQGGVTLNGGMVPDTVRVELWEGEAVPGGENFPPTAMMTVARRGNTQDTERQSFWEISTTNHNITHYWRVDQPILRADNYALCLGILPAILDTAGILPSTRDAQQPSLYVNTIFYENMHHVHFPARVVKEDRGEWTATPTAEYDGRQVSEPYHYMTFTRVAWLIYRNSATWASLSDAELREKMLVEWKVDLEVSRVWHYGCLWECTVDGTTAEPGFSQDWTMVSGQPWRVDFAFDRGTLVWVDDVTLRAEALLLLGTEDVTADVLARVQAGTLDVTWTWQRIGNGDGTQTAADGLWRPTTEDGHPNVLLIDHRLGDAQRRQDCGPLWEQLLRVVFRCTARLSTGAAPTGELGLG